MRKSMNITTWDDDLTRHRNAEELAAFAAQFGLDGLEVMPGPPHPVWDFLPGQVTGVHMRCTSDWLDFWRGDTAALNREYGSEAVWAAQFGGRTRDVLLQRAREDLDYARRVGAEYVVFHVTNIRTSDIFTYRFDYTDAEVIEAAADFINELLDGEPPSFYFLMENLWWPGLRFTDPAMTGELLSRVRYPKKGLMLDTGHLLHTNLGLQTQEEGVDYVMEMLHRHADFLCDVKGVHLHQSISGEYVKKLIGRGAELGGADENSAWDGWLADAGGADEDRSRDGQHECANGAPPPADYRERFARAMEHVFAIDSHDPFTNSRVPEILELVRPEYVTLEFISSSRDAHAAKLRAQARTLGWI